MIRRAKFRPRLGKPHIYLDTWKNQLTITTSVIKRKLRNGELLNHRKAWLYCHSINPDVPYKNPGAAVKALYTTFRGELCTN